CALIKVAFLTSRVIDLRPCPADVPRTETAFRPNEANQLQVSAMNDPQCLADRYVAVWNETDPDRRRRAFAELWRPDGRHYVDTREACGYDALEKRITGRTRRTSATVATAFALDRMPACCAMWSPFSGKWC